MRTIKRQHERWLRRRHLILGGALCVLSLSGVTACSPAVDVAPATASTDPSCAPMMVALPDSLADNKKRETTSQATAAWGNPATVILRCGVTPPEPTTERCVNANGVDWIIREPEPGSETYTLTTYGRVPATELLLNQNEVPSATVLTQLAGAAKKVPQSKQCLSADDVK